MTIINLCPHSIHEVNSNTKWDTPEKKDVVRVGTISERKYINKTILIKNTRIIKIWNMPKEAEKTVYIVSKLVLRGIKTLHPERTDFLAPGNPVRNSKGSPVIGCEGLTSEL